MVVGSSCGQIGCQQKQIAGPTTNRLADPRRCEVRGLFLRDIAPQLPRRPSCRGVLLVRRWTQLRPFRADPLAGSRTPTGAAPATYREFCCILFWNQSRHPTSVPTSYFGLILPRFQHPPSRAKINRTVCTTRKDVGGRRRRLELNPTPVVVNSHGFPRELTNSSE